MPALLLISETDHYGEASFRDMLENIILLKHFHAHLYFVTFLKLNFYELLRTIPCLYCI